MQLRAHALDEIRRRNKIAPLIASHQYVEIDVGAHGFECLTAMIISASACGQFFVRG
jgi:hypothetical protein